MWKDKMRKPHVSVKRRRIFCSKAAHGATHGQAAHCQSCSLCGHGCDANSKHACERCAQMIETANALTHAAVVCQVARCCTSECTMQEERLYPMPSAGAQD